MTSLVERAASYLTGVICGPLQHSATQPSLVIYDQESPLAKILTDAYRQSVPQAQFLSFADTIPEQVKASIFAMSPGSLVILVQSSHFRLNEFRVRLELFARGLKTIEHIHLNRQTEDQFETYIEALAYDHDYYHRVGQTLKERLDQAEKIVVTCDGTQLFYVGGMEEAKLNIGDYNGMKNIGGTFPIGEVFTEAKDFSQVNGEALIFAFAGMDHVVRRYEPFRVQIYEGILEAPGAPLEFLQMLDMIRAEEPVMVREFGLGLNRAMGKDRLVNDITAFERMKGLHLSLGAKHGVYQKPGLKHKQVRYHVDVFVDVQKIEVDGKTLFSEGVYLGER